MLAIALLLAFSMPAKSANAPLLPPDATGDLYVIENDCDCILSITSGGAVSVLVSQANLNTLFAPLGVGEEVYLTKSGLVSTIDGSLYFVARTSISNNTNQRVVKRVSDGTLSFVNTVQQVLDATIETELDLVGLVMGDDNQLYLTDEVSDSLLKMDPDTGITTKLVTKEEFEALIPGASFGVEVGLAADENYIYVATDNTPDTLYRVSYVGVPEVFASGPGVDPTVLLPQKFNLAIQDAVTDGVFELNFDGLSISDIPWDVTTVGLQVLMGELADTITGEGTVAIPWQITLSAGVKLYYINSDLIGGTDELEFTQNYGMVNTVNHVEAVAVEGAAGIDTVSVDIEFDDVAIPLESLDSVWQWNATAAEVKTTIEDHPNFAVGGSVDVTGTGTKVNPWVMTWSGGPYAKQKPRYDGGETNGSGTLYVGTKVNAIAFDDSDGYMTRREDGSLIVEDDSQAHFLYEVTEAGETSIFVNEWELVLANDGSVDMEGGIAFDSNGVLHVATQDEEDEFNNRPGLPAVIFQILPDKTISRWVEASDVIAVTGGDVLDVHFEGMAFQQMSVPNNQEICATLGDNRSWGMDWDIFKFDGEEGDEVAISLTADENGSYVGKRATLILIDEIHATYLFKINRGKLPSRISATLPANGKYKVLVKEQSKHAKGKKFKGDYCLELDSSNGASLEPTSKVE